MKSYIQIALCLMFLTLGACGQNLAKDLPNQPGSRINSVSLEQDYQEVVRYDCNHNVISDRTETVSSPLSLVTISPDDPRNVTGSKFLNTTTGSTAPFVTNLTTFYVDHGEGALSMHVSSGINIINYKFYSSPSTITEQGTVSLNVAYTEKTIPGVLSVNTCSTATPAPTPAPAPQNHQGPQPDPFGFLRTHH